MFIPKKDMLTHAMKRMLNQIAMGLGGRIAEELVLGDISSGAAGDITFQDKNNLAHVVIRDGTAPTVAGVRADLGALAGADPSIKAQPPAEVSIKGSPMIKDVYEIASAPNPVTGKQVTLTVDRYVFAHNGKVAVVDLGTPKGVDNVDGYRLMIESFRWR